MMTDGPVAPGSVDDLRLISLLGPSWRKLCNADPNYKIGQSVSPGFVAEEQWRFIEGVEAEFDGLPAEWRRGEMNTSGEEGGDVAAAAVGEVPEARTGAAAVGGERGEAEKGEKGEKGAMAKAASGASGAPNSPTDTADPVAFFNSRSNTKPKKFRPMKFMKKIGTKLATPLPKMKSSKSTRPAVPLYASPTTSSRIGPRFSLSASPPSPPPAADPPSLASALHADQRYQLAVLSAALVVAVIIKSGVVPFALSFLL